MKLSYDQLTPEETETAERYFSKGYSMLRVLSMLEAKRVRSAIKALSPERLAELKLRAEQFVNVEETGRREIDARLLRVEAERRRRLGRVMTALTVTSLPDINLSGVRGVVAFRGWVIKGGRLCSVAMNSSVWGEVMIADKIPAGDNPNGIHGIELCPEGLMYSGGYLLCTVVGLIEMRGKVVVHTDCTLRAEWARILCLFVTQVESVYEVVPALYLNYPNVPVYVMDPRQLAEVLFRVCMKRVEKEEQARGWDEDWKGLMKVVGGG